MTVPAAISACRSVRVMVVLMALSFVGVGWWEVIAKRLPASRASACVRWRWLSASAMARFGRNSTLVMSSMPVQRSQLFRYGAWKSSPNEGARPGP